MAFNGTKFQCLKYGHNSNIKSQYDYFSGDLEEIIEETSDTRDLGIIMSSSGDFTEQCNNVIKKAKKRSGWICRSFLRNDMSFMKRMWKTYVQSMIDFGSQVWCPTDLSNISNLESVLRHYTERIDDLHKYDYWTRLNKLKMNSIQRRFERYRIIYVWKIRNGLVPNFGLQFSRNDRRGLMVDIPFLKSNVRNSIKTLRDQSLKVHGGRMYNLLPVEIRDFTGTLNDFKSLLDDFLSKIPDQPHGPGLYSEPVSRVTCRNSNSIIDWIHHLKLTERRPKIDEN